MKRHLAALLVLLAVLGFALPARADGSPNAILYEAMVRMPSAFRVRIGLSSERLDVPASMFGHPFLLIGLRSEPELLDVVFEFRAETGSARGLAYAAGGIGGAFTGWFRTTTLAVRSREDSEHDGRDIIVDDLAFRDADVVSLAHAMERAESIRASYYFAGENCAYRLMRLLDDAVPRWQLARSTRWPYVPSDLLRALDRAAAVKGRTIRPSLDRRAREAIARMDPEAARLTRDVAFGGAPVASAQGRHGREVLDTADLLLRIELLERPQQPAVVARRHAILLERARSRTAPGAVEDAPRTADPVSHRSGRLRFGQGYDGARDRGYFDVEGRVALHDLTDPPAFFSASELEAMKLRLRAEPVGSVRAESFELLHVMRTETAPAFQLAVGARRFRDEASPDLFAPRIEAGLGRSVAHGPLLLAVFSELEVSGHPKTHGIDDSVIRTDLGGLAVGRFAPKTVPVIASVRARAAWVVLSPNPWTWEASAFAGYRLADGVASLGLEARATPRGVEEALVSSLYF